MSRTCSVVASIDCQASCAGLVTGYVITCWACGDDTCLACWLRTQPKLVATLGELRGMTLGCWCAPKLCHGDVLARLAMEAPRAL